MLHMPSPMLLGQSAPDAFIGADFVMDFANGYYRRGATVGTSPSDIAVTVNGAATIDGNGLLCDAAGESVSFAYALSSGTSFIIVTDYAAQTAGTLAGLFDASNGGSPNILALYKSGTNTVSQSSVSLSAAYAASGKVANGFNATEHVISRGGGVIQRYTQYPPNLANTTRYVGNLESGSYPALVPIRSFAIYLGVFSDAQIRAMATT
jgi:hypothetical protein